MEDKKGLSEVITTLIIILLVLVATVILWTTINNIINGKIGSSQSCFGVVGQVSIERSNLCYNSSSPSNPYNQTKFEINVGNVVINSILVSISGNLDSRTITLANQSQTISNLTYYNGTTSVTIPPKNSGRIYLLNWTYNDNVNIIKIAPIVNGNQCDTIDTAQIQPC